MRLSRLRGRKIVDHVLRKGMLWKGKHMSVRFLMGAPRHPHVDQTKGLYTGLVASTKLDASAVKRNRMRRRCREAFRITVKNLPDRSPVKLLILPRSSSLTCTFGELLTDAEKLLQYLPSWQSKTIRQ
ncbi:MAG: ribonuclease P protein component, partial [Patescibacteria group bacterium]